MIMGRTSERMDILSNILNNSEGAHVEIDNAPGEFRKKSPGRPKKKTIEFYSYCGMKVPNEIYDICMYLENLLKEQGKWSPALAVQVYNCAVQQWVYNDLITNKITQKEVVPTRALTTASESLRRALQSTGLTVTDKKSGITKEQVEVNPLAEFLEKMDDNGPDEVIVKKPKKKVK